MQWKCTSDTGIGSVQTIRDSDSLDCSQLTVKVSTKCQESAGCVEDQCQVSANEITISAVQRGSREDQFQYLGY